MTGPVDTLRAFDQLACHACDGHGRVVVEVIYNGDCSYPDVEDCDRCDGSGLRCICPAGPVTWETRDPGCLVHGDDEPLPAVLASDVELPF